MSSSLLTVGCGTMIRLKNPMMCPTQDSVKTVEITYID